MKFKRYNTNLFIKVATDQKHAWAQAAFSNGKSLSEWVREAAETKLRDDFLADHQGNNQTSSRFGSNSTSSL